MKVIFSGIAICLVAHGLFGQSFPGAIATDQSLLVAHNTAETKLASSLSSGSTSVVVVSAALFGANMAFTIGTENIFCTNLTGNTFSGCARGFDGSTAASHAIDSAVTGYLIAKHHNGLKDEIKAIETALGVNLLNVATSAVQQAGAPIHCRSTTGNDSYVCSVTPALTAYTRGGCILLDADTANTGAATINVDSLGAKSILSPSVGALSTGDITANAPKLMCYDGTEFIIQGGGGTATAPSGTGCAAAASSAFTATRVITAGAGVTVTNGDCSANPTIVADTSFMLSRANAQAGTTLNLTETSSSGTTYTATMSPTLTAYTANMEVHWIPVTLCTAGAITINIDTLGAKSLKEADGTTNPVAGDCPAGKPLTLKYDGTVYRIGGTPASSGGSGAFAASAGVIPAVTQTASDVTIYSVSSVPALAAGSCYFFRYGFSQTGATNVVTKLYIDSTNVGTIDPAHDWTGDPRQLEFSYCNDAGVQNAQHVYDLGSKYCNTATDPCPQAVVWTSYTAIASPTAMTGISLATTHTFAIKTNAASGTITGNVFRMGQ